MPPTTEQSINEEMKKFKKEFSGILEIKFTPEDVRVPPVTLFVDEKIENFLRSSLLSISKQSREETLAEVRKIAKDMKKFDVVDDPFVIPFNFALETLITNLPK